MNFLYKLIRNNDSLTLRFVRTDFKGSFSCTDPIPSHLCLAYKFRPSFIMIRIFHQSSYQKCFRFIRFLAWYLRTFFRDVPIASSLGLGYHPVQAWERADGLGVGRMPRPETGVSHRSLRLRMPGDVLCLRVNAVEKIDQWSIIRWVPLYETHHRTRLTSYWKVEIGFQIERVGVLVGLSTSTVIWYTKVFQDKCFHISRSVNLPRPQRL